eukprot:scaffold298981_cov22-Tisochrysis_lutea.AAC.1
MITKKALHIYAQWCTVKATGNAGLYLQVYHLTSQPVCHYWRLATAILLPKCHQGGITRQGLGIVCGCARCAGIPHCACVARTERCCFAGAVLLCRRGAALQEHYVSALQEQSFAGVVQKQAAGAALCTAPLPACRRVPHALSRSGTMHHHQRHNRTTGNGA